MDAIKLTQFSHGGGCGCKIAPAVLAELLAHSPVGVLAPDLLVGTDTSDDAAVYRLNDQQAVIATTDFFTPIVNDPYDFGRIAATNALSDVYAMGGSPIMALAIVGMPLDKLPKEAIARILEGGASICKEAGIPLAGGHSIDIPEPVYGLVGIGVVDPARMLTNAKAQAGDVLILTKPLGVGILSSALRKDLLREEEYAEMLKWTTTLNKAGAQVAQLSGVHAMTDVTGFGLAGHLLEMCKGAKLSAQIQFNSLPIIQSAIKFASDDIATGASSRNWLSYGEHIMLPPNIKDWQHVMLTDPQTSGGLLIACDPANVDEVQHIIEKEQGSAGTVIGSMLATTDGVSVTFTL